MRFSKAIKRATGGGAGLVLIHNLSITINNNYLYYVFLINNQIGSIAMFIQVGSLMWMRNNELSIQIWYNHHCCTQDIIR